MTIEPLREARDHFSEIVDRVHLQHERVTVTKNGRPVAVVVSPDDLSVLEETLATLLDEATMRDLAEAEGAYARDDVVRGVDAARALRRPSDS